MNGLIEGDIPGEIKRGTELGRVYSRNLYQWLPCAKCGKHRWVALLFREPVSVVCPQCREYKPRPSMWGANHFRWRGGRSLRASGYIIVRIYPDNPYYAMACKNNYILEHRLVMAQALGRCLLPQEQVHHKNGLRTDNSPDNLELSTINAHTGNHNALLQEVRMLRQQVRVLKRQLYQIQSHKEARCGFSS